MLDKAKLLKEIDKKSNSLFSDFSNELTVAFSTWQNIVLDQDFQSKLKNISTDLLIPSWQDDISKIIKVKLDLADYQIIGVDGSQIYPDRHQGSNCFLINTGSVVMRYGKEPFALFESQPELFFDEDVLQDIITDFSSEYVDALRELKEIACGFSLSKKHVYNNSLLMLDGSLIFWHLVSKQKAFKDYFFSEYCKIFKELCFSNILYCAYTSLPRNKEIINLVKVKLSDFDLDNQASYKFIDNLTDTSILQTFLPQFCRTIVFKNNASISQGYEPCISPYFFYINVVSEIARVEIPEFIAHSPEKLDFVATAALNQALKGRGYPIVLAESHEQAVVKNYEKEFFYEILKRIGLAKKSSFSKSQKALKKLRMSC